MKISPIPQYRKPPCPPLFSEFVKNPERFITGLYRLWKTGKVMKFKNFMLQAWKVMEFTCRSWKMMENFKKFYLVD